MYRTSAILITGNRCTSSFADRDDLAQPNACDFPADSLACVETLGESVLERTVGRIEKAGIKKITVITGETGRRRGTRDVRIKTAESLNGRWLAAGRALEECARQKQKVDAVLLAVLGAHAELDLAGAFQFHRAQGQIATPLYDGHGPLDWWIVDPRRLLATGNVSLPLREDGLRAAPARYFIEGYVNRLSDVHDLRRLIVDAFAGRCTITPRGREIRPGIWVADGARLHKSARLVAPAYVGRNTRVESAAVITQFSNLERNCLVGEGSVVANASVLPHTTIGRGLDVCSALVAGSEFVDLSRNVRVRIQDPHLISGAVPANAHAPDRLPDFGRLDRPHSEPEPEYSYLSRAAGRLMEVFKGEV